ncbi:SNARE domain-containing protein [Natronobacterium gregoryi]|uniref:Uncharacterized protein n=2 Tax=Natronobacterium gregoryi TaxID=44930 RepID=L9XVL2_NATGS|nr:hypothetical protein [Natronobacterium gregoryi]ELY65815.1 hypothetical protein C490_13586 [Natronobacterium gregoryi SP2]PLK19445.1 hypothetical protein CYV19_14870 [Natronobacterium gregoryi SP2]SFJ48623.1 hypothetical protein SAMN05443661_13335 [Natronobacterium gregoryi]
MKFTFNGQNIDVHSQRIILGLKGGRVRGVQDLARVAGWDVDRDPGARNKARHRLENNLVPAGLVEVAGTTHKQGGEATMFQLTDLGKDALAEELPPEFAGEPTVSTNAQRIEDLEETVASLQERIERESQRIDDRPTRQTLKRYEEQYDDLVDKSERLIAEAKEFRNSAWEAVWEVRDEAG